MTKDEAEKIADRILNRIESDNNSVTAGVTKERIAISVSRASLVEEIMAGFALVEPMGTKRVSASEASKIWDDRVRKNNDAEHDAKVRRMYEMLQHQAADAERQRVADRWIKQFYGVGSLAQGGVIGLSGGYVTHHESDPISGYRATPCDEPVKARDNPMGYSHAYCYGRWSQQQMLDAGYRNDVESRCYTPK